MNHSVNGGLRVSVVDYSHNSGRSDANNYAKLNSFNTIAIKFWKGLNETVFMVAFHIQRLKDSICGEFWQNINVMGEENYAPFMPEERETRTAECACFKKLFPTGNT